MQDQKILLLTLHSFSLTGGIEKVCRSLSKVLKDLFEQQKIKSYQVLSMYDSVADLKYVNQKSFKGFNANRFRFACHAIKFGSSADVIILSHVNLLIFGWIIRKIKPGKRIILFAHGIEIWTKLTRWKTNFIRKHVEIFAVSKFTADTVQKVHQLNSSKITVLNNCLDPFFAPPESFDKPLELMERYGLSADAQVLFTLNRLSGSEQYKGYDKVIEALSELPRNVIYILGGKADAGEELRIKELMSSFELEQRVILTGFIADDEIVSHYLLADVFIMPSKAEGFGISFIEAAACGRRSICGNLDGSRDAILNGTLGRPVNPDNKPELLSAIIDELSIAEPNAEFLQSECMKAFSHNSYSAKIAENLTARAVQNI